LKTLLSPFWIATGLIYTASVLCCLWRKPRQGKPTPKAVLEYEEWAKSQLELLYQERAERVEAAFLPRLFQDGTVTERLYAFRRWVELSSGGAIRVAGKLFHADASFRVVAKDERETDRAVVTCHGDGVVCILSQGVSYSAMWSEGKWQVEESPRKEIAGDS
jgi:hypothetical protein